MQDWMNHLPLTRMGPGVQQGAGPLDQHLNPHLGLAKTVSDPTEQLCFHPLGDGVVATALFELC